MTETKQDSAQRHYDGTGFRVTIDQKQVTLTVYPRVVGSEPVSVEDVNKFFAQQGWPRVDAYTLASVVKMSDGQPHVIVDDLPAVAVDASFSVRVANNRMHAFGLVKPAVWGRPLTMDNLKSKLTEAGISFGVKEDVLAQIVLNQSREREWLVAEGQEPVHGIHARIEYVEQIKKSPRTFAFLPDGRVDFRELDNIINVEPGEVLARRIPPTPGKPGYNVLGEEIAPKPGRELNWPLGKGVEVVDDHIVASIAGQVVLKHNKVHVLPVYDVAGDVDYSVGNIRFLGNVFIRGSVRPGFTVEADGDINILGWVDSANIACSGDLTVSGGIQGQGRGQVSVEGDIYTKFIENCTVTAKGNVVVGEDIMHSRVLAGGSIQVGGRKGLLSAVRYGPPTILSVRCWVPP